MIPCIRTGCKKEFAPSHDGQKYCSKKCRKMDHYRRREIRERDREMAAARRLEATP